jgi:Na+:H+ antiporter, NhaC family
LTENHRLPSLGESLVPIVVLILLLGLNVSYFGDDTLSGSNQMALLFAAAIAALLSFRLGYKWDELLQGAVHSISSAMPSMIILLLIGSLAGTWLLSGVVPALIYYGLMLLNPAIFLVAACVISAIISLATGSSWSTIATLGIALLGIGKALGWGEGMIAGAIISGAYFGDKMSPLSDTTNLAPAMAGTDLFTHIRYMIFTTGPSMLLTIVIFSLMGFNGTGGGEIVGVEGIKEAISGTFNINVFLFLVPAVVIFLIIKKTAAIPALSIGVVLGAVFALIFQSHLFPQISGIEGGFKGGYMAILISMFRETNLVTGNAAVDDLLHAGGMAGMLNTIWLVICAMTFGGIMEKNGMLTCIGHKIIGFARSTGSLVASTAGTCIFFNLTASDQYLAIVVPGRMFANTYRERNLKPEVLSRTLEDSGTVTSVLVPWNTCGATQASILGVATMSYLPYAFFNIISPMMTVAFAYLNIKIRRIDNGKED